MVSSSSFGFPTLFFWCLFLPSICVKKTTFSPLLFQKKKRKRKKFFVAFFIPPPLSLSSSHFLLKPPPHLALSVTRRSALTAASLGASCGSSTRSLSNSRRILEAKSSSSSSAAEAEAEAQAEAEAAAAAAGEEEEEEHEGSSFFSFFSSARPSLFPSSPRDRIHSASPAVRAGREDAAAALLSSCSFSSIAFFSPESSSSSAALERDDPGPRHGGPQRLPREPVTAVASLPPPPLLQLVGAPRPSVPPRHVDGARVPRVSRKRDDGARGRLAPPCLVEQRLVGDGLAGVGVEPAALVRVENLGPDCFLWKTRERERGRKE